LAVALWLLTTALSLVAVALMVANLAARTSGTDPLASWGLPGFGSLFGLTFGTVGFIVARRLPGNVIGWIFGAIGLLFSIEAFLIEYATAALVTYPGRLPAGQELAWILAWIWVPPVILATNLLPLVFPTGHLASPRWRPAIWLGVVATVVSSATLAVVPGPITQVPFAQNPVGIPGLDLSSPVAGSAIFVPLLLAIALGAAGLLHRFRAATGDARQQIKWLLLACSGVGAGLLLSGAEYMFTGAQTKPFQVIVLIAALGIPVAAGLAILRYRLYEIDRIISRTLSYAAVTGVLAAIFASVVLVFALISPFSSAEDPIPVAGSTLIVAVLFQPLRRRIQVLVDRRFDRARVDAERTVAELAERLRDEVELASVRREVLATVGQALRPSDAVVWLRER
jgi:hypothetical protein